MPLIERTMGSSTDQFPARQRYRAVVALPAWNASKTIAATLRSVAASVEHSAGLLGRKPSIAVSVVDDCSDDDTCSVIAKTAEGLSLDLYLHINTNNLGRGRSRNIAVSRIESDYLFFLDHDDHYLPEHISICLAAFTEYPRADFVKTVARLSDPVHPDWKTRISWGLTQNLCVKRYCHRMIGGFHEEPEVETYGCDDVLYNRLLHQFFLPCYVDDETVEFVRRPGNSFDRQYRGKFSRPFDESEMTLSERQQAVASHVENIRASRVAQVQQAFTRLALKRFGMAGPLMAKRIESLGVTGVGQPGPRLPSRVPASAAKTTPAESSPESFSQRTECRIDLADLSRRFPIRFSNHGHPVYAIMVTGKSSDRISLARNSVLSFLAQTHENRYLVIVNHGDFSFKIEGLENGRIIQIRPDRKISLGKLRNVALDSLPSQAIWVTWDDDDWHHPDLIAKQGEVLTKLDIHTCLLRHQVKYSFSTDTAFSDFYPGGFGGTLMSRNTGLRFPDLSRAEDSAYCREVKKTLSWFAWDNPSHLFLRFYHGNNTWNEGHFQFGNTPEGHWNLRPESAQYLEEVLSFYR